MSVRSDLVTAVRMLRSEGWTQEAIGATFGLGRGSVSDYERGRYQPAAYRAERAFDHYRDLEAQESTRHSGAAKVTYEEMWLPRSYSVESDMAYWQKRNRGADAYYILMDDNSGGKAQGRVSSTGQEAVGEALKVNSMYKRKQTPATVIEGVTFVAVYYH